MTPGVTPHGESSPALRRARRAIADLFLDTELDDDDLRRLAEELRASGLPLAELDRIYFDELAPLLHTNLSSTAGAWSGFDPEWLEAQVAKRRARPGFPFLRRLNRYLVSRSTIQDWRRLRGMVDAR